MCGQDRNYEQGLLGTIPSPAEASVGAGRIGFGYSNREQKALHESEHRDDNESTDFTYHDKVTSFAEECRDRTKTMARITSQQRGRLVTRSRLIVSGPKLTI